MQYGKYPAFALVLATAAFGGEAPPIEIPAKSFTQAELNARNPKKVTGDLAAMVRRQGHPGGGLFGTLTYDFTVPADGFYVLQSPYPDRNEFGVDGIRQYYTRYTHPECKPGNFKEPQPVSGYYLKSGRHQLTVSRTRWPESLPKFDKFTLQKSVTPADSMRVCIDAPFENEFVTRLGQPLPLAVEYANFPAAAKLGTVLTGEDGKTAGTFEFPLPATVGKRVEKFSIPVQNAGIFRVSFTLDGKPLTGAQAKNLQLIAIDAAPVAASSAEPKKTLVAEIDCVKTAPDYRNGETRIVEKPFGAYRLTDSNFGFSRDRGESKNASWAAWKIALPEANAPYVFEFDYPDDAGRSTMFAVRESVEYAYPKTISVDCGDEFKLSHKMQTARMIVWPFTREPRVLVTPGALRSNGAIARIRVYKIDAGKLAPLLRAENGKRNYLNFYEEEGSLIGHYSAVRGESATPRQRLDALERYCQLAAHTGFNTLLFGIVVYGGDLYPTWKIHTSPFGSPYANDFARMMLLTAEKYGLNVVFDFSYNRKPALGKYFMTDNCLLDFRGKPDYWTFHNFQANPIHPATVAWREGAIREFAERYRDAANFKGIRIRNMTWQNNGVNNFGDIRYGYDDYTVKRFTADTGIAVPTAHSDFRRFAERHAFLTGPKYREWIAWRVGKITGVYAEALAILRSIRPDLGLWTNTYGPTEKHSREAGIDRAELDRSGVALSQGASIGRHKDVEGNRARFLASFDPRENSACGVRSYYIGLPYLEGGHWIALPGKLGLKRNPDKVWYGGASWASRDNLLNPFALALGRLDVNDISTGGIAYSFADAPIREFMAEYRLLPAAPFETVALDPVAVRRHGDFLYAVNTLPVPAEVVTDASNGAVRAVTGKAFDLRKFTLEPYQLRVFKFNGKIGKVSVAVPANYRKTVESQVQLLDRYAKLPEIAPIAAAVKDAWQKGEYWKLNNLLDRHAPVLAENGVVIPSMRELGQFPVPAGAYRAAGAPTDAAKILPFWRNETFALGKTLAASPEVAADGKYTLVAAFAGGDRFAPVQVWLDGKMIGAFDNVGGDAYATIAPLREKLDLTAGKPKLEFRSADGKRDIAVLYYTLEPKLEKLWPALFLVSESTHYDASVKPEEYMAKSEPAATDRNLTAPRWKAGTGDKNDPYFVQGRGASKPGNVGYMLLHIKSPKARTVEIGFGADYFFKIDCNGKPVCSLSIANGKPQPNQHRYLLPLNAGWNEVLIKLGSGSDANGLWMTVNDPGDLRFSPDKKSEIPIKPFDKSTMLDVDFKKLDKAQLQALLKAALPLEHRYFQMWFEYTAKNAPKELRDAWKTGEDKFNAAAKIRQELMLANAATAPVARQFAENFGELRYRVGGMANNFNFFPARPADLTGPRQALWNNYHKAWKNAALTKTPRYAEAETAALQSLTAARTVFDLWWNKDAAAYRFRNGACSFNNRINALRAEIKKRP